MPQAQHQHIAARGQDRIAHDVSGRAERNHDLTDVGVFGRPAKIGKLLDPLQPTEDRPPGPLGGYRMMLPMGRGLPSVSWIMRSGAVAAV